ncbi:hypothetical protein DITRI_Ditri05aG0072700 [Diplodiscus trichospermus]
MALSAEPEIPLKQLQEFHNIDRKAYYRLIICLGFDPFPSMTIIAFRESAKTVIEDFVKDVCQIAFFDIVLAYLARKQSSKSNKELQCQTTPEEDNGELLMQQMAAMTEDKARVDSEDRTLFMTFSRGHPVSNQELHGFFVRKFGRCVEAIYMDEKNPKPLFCFLVLRSLSDMSRILGGKKLVKLVINGNQVRARRFVPKTVKQSQCTAAKATGFPVKAA